MAQTNPYERYLERLTDRKSQNSNLRASNRLARSLNPEFKKQQRSLDIMSAKGQLTGGAEAQASLDIATKKAETIGTFQQKALDADLIRREGIQDKIDELEIGSEQWEEAEADRLERERQQGLAGAIKTGGTIIGGIAGAFLGQPALGASIGGGLGSLIGASVTDDEYVNDLQAVSSGIGDIGLGIASGLSIASENAEMKANTSLAQDVIGLSDEQFDALGVGMERISFMNSLMSQMNMDGFNAEDFRKKLNFDFLSDVGRISNTSIPQELILR